jgi:thiamine-monophosphate kinase
MMDLSDGLARDLNRLCTASGISAEIIPDRLPATPTVSQMDDRTALQVGFGEDYELLFTASPENGSNVLAIGEQAGVQLSRIGCCTVAGSSPSAQLLGTPWPDSHFAHFGAIS